jgi:molybdopterin molybdotransferase
MPSFFSVLPPSEALDRLFQALPSSLAAETIPTAEALGRVSAQAIVAPEPLPAFSRAMMDGYAVRAQDTFGAGPAQPACLIISGEATMGRAPAFRVGAGQAALVYTGGMLPKGADAVVMLELTQAPRHNEIEVLRSIAPGENVLRAGGDVASGAVVLPAGHRLRPQDLGALSALGLTQVTVARRPRVALLATGDELVPPEAQPGPGQVRDVNSYSLAAQIEQAGGLPRRGGIVPDNLAALSSAAQAALDGADALVLSAGSSLSTRDLSAAVIGGLGPPGILVHGVAVKPGKPTILAVAGGKPVIGLPGNPAAAMVICDLFVVPTLYRLQGQLPPPPRTVRARLTRNLPSQSGRLDFVPARLRTAADGAPEAEPSPGQASQIFTLVAADGLIVIPSDVTGVAAGEMVEVRLF